MTQIQITKCLSGRECLEKIASEHYDVVLLDHMMPEMDGVETLKRALEMPESMCKDTPFIALTANAIVGMREKYLAIGFSDYISKPIAPQKLEMVLQHYIPSEKVHIVGEDAVSAPHETAKADTIRPNADRLLDVKSGLDFSGGIEDMYKEFLEIFCDMLPEKRQALQTAIEEQDWESYTITVHSLKSNALNIGGKTLSEIAGELEQAGKKIRNGDDRRAQIDWILKNHPRCMELYEKTAGEARDYLNANG